MSQVAHAGKLESYWSTSAPRRTRPPLTASTTADVCIVGAGIAGLSIAYFLTREGKRVVVLDDGQIGGGQTEVTTAHLSNVLDRRYFDLVRYHGHDGARLAAGSHAQAIDWIESVVQEEAINCDFERLEGYLFAHNHEANDILDREYFTVHRLGLDGVLRLGQGPAELSQLGPCLLFPNQGQFHPLKYLVGLAEAIQKLGGRIFGGSHVRSLVGGKDARAFVEGGFIVTAENIVVATNTPVNDMFAIHTKQAPYITYVIAATVPRGSLPHALFWDTDDPYHYVRLQRGEENAEYDLLIVGGEDHKTGQANDGDERWCRLEEWARKRFPQMLDVEYTWSGQVMESVDGLGYIGHNPGDESNVYVATGDSGLGMTHSTIAGRLITDLILGRANPWQKIYEPSRKIMAAAPEFAKENLNVALQYIDWLTPGEVSSADEIPPGQGAILREGISKVAVYRNKYGELTRLSAVCPHLKCLVHWNGSEGTWDCPCHGSRFAAEGKVLNGPANVGLQPIHTET